MKTIFYFLALSSLIGFTLFTSSCSSSKKAQASKTAPTKKEKSEASVKKTKTNTAAVANKKTTTTTTAKSTDVFVPLVPNTVENVFNTNYPSASNVEWAKESLSNKSAEYKASFSLNQNKNWVIYNENGDLVESRIQITPDQLPQNIYNAIQNKYPNAHIVSATTFKNSNKDGSYTAMIKPPADNKEVEVILSENGTFIK